MKSGVYNLLPMCHANTEVRIKLSPSASSLSDFPKLLLIFVQTGIMTYKKDTDMHKTMDIDSLCSHNYKSDHDLHVKE